MQSLQPLQISTMESPQSLIDAQERSEVINSTSDTDPDEKFIEDLSGNTWDLSDLKNSSATDDDDDSVKGLYVYKNIFNLIPRKIGKLNQLKKLKFFANEINLLPLEIGNLVDLEQLQLKVVSPEVSNLSLQKLKSLKELELSKVERSAFPLLFSEICELKCLKKLTLCHFEIKYLPSEIGELSTLEELDVSSNKLKNLPEEITRLDELRLLNVANNKLEGLPSGMSNLGRLENLDLSNNRLTSLGAFELEHMKTLKVLDLQCNKIPGCLEVPSWITCNLEGNSNDMTMDDSSVSSSCLSSDISLNKRSPTTTTKVGKAWKRLRHPEKPQKRLKLQHQGDEQLMCVDESKDSKLTDVSPKLLTESISSSVAECGLSSGIDCDDKEERAVVSKCDPITLFKEDKNLIIDSVGPKEGCDSTGDTLHGSSLGKRGEHVGNSASNPSASKSTPKSKRQFGDDLENPKPKKSQKPFSSSTYLSNKYSTESLCEVDDHLPDGFYDAGRCRPFMPLECYEKNLCLDTREVIVVDREIDDELDVIISSAKELVTSMKQPSSMVELEEHSTDDDLQRASLLALFVSNWFGGSDRSNLAVKTRKAWSASNYEKPFVCTCTTGNSNTGSPPRASLSPAEQFNFTDICEKSLKTIKQTRNSVVVPIGSLRLGVCRHRAVLMKYLCDRMVPPVPCELVRGYLEFSPHAWNVVPVRRNGSAVRMVVDACCPTDMREETDPEYFCRYIPLSKIHVSVTSEDIEKPSSTISEKVETSSSSLVRGKFGSLEAVAKVRTLNTQMVSDEEVKNFEFTCLGEVRMLRALMPHSCIVEVYGHQISSKWDGNKENRVFESAIWMEFIEGGSLKSYIEQVSKTGAKQMQVELALFIARDIACALAELHSKHIIHRDIKSDNILIDIDRKRADGSPVVKVCDFDRAVPLHSSSHTCCIGHFGIPRLDVCVGTPRWMAPEVLESMNERKMYGMEVDIWSYGCVLVELLTLQIPYAAYPVSGINDILVLGKRPPLTEKLEKLVLSDVPALDEYYVDFSKGESETEILKFLVYLFRKCTERDPKDRPTAADIYEMLNASVKSLASSNE
ncbi:hypothetical protein ACHQM5_026492 [Ranunculus cassubicifolius]